MNKQKAISEQKDAALRLLLLAAEATSYGHFDVARRRAQNAALALSSLPVVELDEDEDPWTPDDSVCPHGMALWLCVSPAGTPMDPHYPVHL